MSNNMSQNVPFINLEHAIPSITQNKRSNKMNKERFDKLPRGRALTPHNESFREDAQRVYDELRAQAPRFDDPEFGRTLLTSFDDVRTVIRDKRFSVNAAFSNSESYMRRIAATGLDVREGDTAYEPPLVLLDDPDHRRVRGLMSKAFTPRAVENMRPRIEEIANGLLDAIGDRSEFDLIEERQNDGTPDDPSEQIAYSESGNWEFPIGTVIVKHFNLLGLRVETRFFVHGSDGT